MFLLQRNDECMERRTRWLSWFNHYTVCTFIASYFTSMYIYILLNKMKQNRGLWGDSVSKVLAVQP